MDYIKYQKLINETDNIVFLTGAGVSTLSGIPDYRSKNGIYNKSVLERPEYLLSKTAFINDPDKQYLFIKENMLFPDAKPNIIHQKIASLSKQKNVKLITQNVDGLDKKAKIKAENIIEFHGNIFDIYCPLDNQKAELSDYLKSNKRPDGKLLRPKITFYEEVPYNVEKSVHWIKEADLIVIVGTSFQVYPFASLIEYASEKCKIVSINNEFINTNQEIDQIIMDAGEFFKGVDL